MRSYRAALAAVVLATTASVVAATATVPSHADPQRPELPAAASDRAEQALEIVQDVLSGVDRDVEPSTALLQLFRLRDQLRGDEREQADRILARPDGQSPGWDWDQDYGIAWSPSSEARPLCNATVCVHYVTSGKHAATYRQARATLAAMAHSWKREVGDLRFRRPRRDGTRGNRRGHPATRGKVDVYLAELSDMGAFGYASPESEPRATDDGKARTATGYLVLDQDFAEYGCPSPAACRRVTAAHELFHLVQYAYSTMRESDRWFMEATATWMEERVYDGINDNRGYLRFGQLAHPGARLTTTNQAAEYGNWLFFEFVTQKVGARYVRAAWTYAGRGWTWRRSVARALAYAGPGLPLVYARYAANNLFPGRTYSEGRAYQPSPPVSLTQDFGKPGLLGPGTTKGVSHRVDLLASASERFRPWSDLPGSSRIAFDVSLPAGHHQAVVIVAWKAGHLSRYRVRLDDGQGRRVVSFDPSRVHNVNLTLANISNANDVHLQATASVL